MKSGVMKKYTLSIVSTFFNEEKIILSFLKRVRATCKKMQNNNLIKRYEIILVDDSSTDNSFNLLKKEISKKDLLLLKTSRNFGVSECTMAGMREATGDALVYLDSDLQDPPELIETLCKKWFENPEYDVVYTTRRKRYGESSLKLFITKVGYRLINKIAAIPIPIDSGDFKLLSRRVYMILTRIHDEKPFIRGLVTWIGFRQISILYDRDERADGRRNTKSKVLSAKVINYWLDQALISFSDIPLKMILFCGFIVSIFALVYINVVLVQKVLGIYVPGWPALMAAILLLGGVQIFMLGIIGLYLGAVFRQSKNRPLFIIEKRLGLNCR